MDESGCTGKKLDDEDQPIFVLAGISVADQKWNNTQVAYSKIIDDYFNNKIPKGFELHSLELLSPNGEGPFAGHKIEKRLGLVRNILDLLDELGHDAFFYAIEKCGLSDSECDFDLCYDYKFPYLTAFDYLVTFLSKIGSLKVVFQ